MKIALVQQYATKSRKDNIRRGLLALEEAASNGIDLIAYPELAFNWFLPQKPFSPEILQYAESIPGPTTRMFCQKAKELGVVVVLNLFEKDENRTYDSSPVIDADGSIVGKTRMIHIINAPLFHEKGYYSPGNLGAGAR